MQKWKKDIIIDVLYFYITNNEKFDGTISSIIREVNEI